MSTLHIIGGRRLAGQIAVGGNKNAALPLMAACLLTSEECILENVPRIRDVEVLAALLRDLGARVDGVGTSTLKIRCDTLRSDRPDPDLVGRLRGSVLLLGPLLARCGSARLAQPGGDFPARRTISTHIQALAALGARQRDEPGTALEVEELRGASMYLDEASVTGTETALLAAVAARGRTIIRHAACEPHVVELCALLRGMGADISGEGSSTIVVGGGGTLHGARHRLHGDYIEAGSWAVVGAITGGHLDITGARAEDVEPIAAVIAAMGVRCSYDDDHFVIEGGGGLRAVRRITTGLWPGFPSDVVSLVTVLATQAQGRTLVHDWMYELRLFALEQLSAMRADLFLCDPHRIIVSGPSQLKGRALDSRDIRSGMALIAAALSAEGESRLAPLETVERGYADLVDHLRSLGADVERVDRDLE